MTVIARDSADPVNGYDEREKIFIDGRPGKSWLAGYWPGSPEKPARGPYPDCTNCLGAANDAADNVGDRYDLFQPGDVLTPWSNPALSIWNGAAFVQPQGAPVGVHFLAGKSGPGSYALRIVRGDLSALPPSKPTGLTAERSEGGCPLLQWSPNREPLVTDPGLPGTYSIERSFDGSGWTPVAELRHPGRVFRETCAGWPREAPHALYRVRVTDGRGRSSNWSEPLRVPIP
ncbi:MAG: hypothetical protein IPP94_18940 [Ignavibacteria bacterium]|nr:hypothetical protein [Ignavibacteria bacterium]